MHALARLLTSAVLPLALALAAAGCASTGAVARPRPFPTPAGAERTSPSAPLAASEDDAAPSRASSLVDTALALRGAPYRNGGTDPSGFDCSGFTQYVFARHGLALPRDVVEQFQLGDKVKADNLIAGDLVFFRTGSRGASHVGIALGDDEFIHAPSSTGVVRVERLSAVYWSRRFLSGRRISPTRSAPRPLPSDEESAADDGPSGR